VSTRLVVRGGWVLTLGARSSNFTEADVLIEGDRIIEVGPGLRARDAETIDATEAIVMPGFVDGHRHAWKSLFRNAGDGEVGFADLAPHHEPDDVYASVSVGLASALAAGITTVVDWSDIQLSDSHTDAVLQAHADSGMRTVFVYAPPPGTQSDHAAAFARLADRTVSPLTTFGAGPDDLSVDDLSPRNLEASTAGWGEIRRHGWRIHVHAGRGNGVAGMVSELGRMGVLADDVTFVHCSRLDDDDLDAIAASGASVVITPSTEMAGGLGSPPMQRLIDRGIRPGLGVDDERIAPGDLFAQMRAAISIQHGRHFDLKLAGKGGLPNLLTTREVIRYATLDGARTAGLAAVSGSLEPGKQADLVVLRTDRPNIHPINDPIGAVVWGMDTSNVSWVVVGGRVLVADGSLAADVATIRDRATESMHRVSGRAGLVGAGGVER
jgi:5-methylthioadenosine/S-adenosylhomocysteine deaminase